jgi:hypothetical protein
MSEEAKKTVKEAKEFFKKVEEGATKYQAIPDSGLKQKIQKVREHSVEVVKYIEERNG